MSVKNQSITIMKKTYGYLMLYSVVLMALAACENNSMDDIYLRVADANTIRATNIPTKKPITTLNRDPGLTIVDVDKNGVRDDIDTLIRQTYTLVTDVRAATQYAKAVQMEVAPRSLEPSDAAIIFTALISAVDCAVAQMGAAKNLSLTLSVQPLPIPRIGFLLIVKLK